MPFSTDLGIESILPGTRVLALSPHTDDIELGAGATVARLASKGVDVLSVVFTRAETKDAEKDSLAECKEAVKVLGIKTLSFLDFPVRRFNEHRQDILDHLIKIRNTEKIDLVLTPARHDTHQDHATITMEAIRAFKKTRILGYDLPWNTVGHSQLDFFVSVTEEGLAQKEEALACYKGQMDRSFFQPGTIRAIARFRGEQCGEPYAECFECIRWKL
ncbi:MAG: PIG-L deacetylase family protein [Nitrospirota bacterium]